MKEPAGFCGNVREFRFGFGLGAAGVRQKERPCRLGRAFEDGAG
jgi:hypothetical protein